MAEISLNMSQDLSNTAIAPVYNEEGLIEKNSFGTSGKKSQKYSEMIPQELLWALTEASNLVKSEEGKLAPVKTLKAPKEIRKPRSKGFIDGVWHHSKRRIKYRHLIEHPISDRHRIGSRNVSFLFDTSASTKSPVQSLNQNDRSATRLNVLQEDMPSNSNLAIPDSVIPNEFRIVKSKAVLGLDYVDGDMTTKLVDHEEMLRVFPSLKPAKRFEVTQLMKTMDQMLSKAGIDNMTNEDRGPTQMHNLLRIIKKEQQIYDIVFHEVIRQSSIECVERGQLLSKLRQRYSDLLCGIPRQIESLHAEVIAQRSLDRRLTEELFRFKSSIGNLTNELIAVREHDKKITYEAEVARVDLAEALKESQKNANLVDEYHDLYELQRRRLENQINQLTYERDLWCNASYSLALKVISENSMSTMKRLHVSEKAWHKLACHFNVLISDHDTESLVQLQNHVEAWRDLLFKFHQELEAEDRKTSDVLEVVLNGVRQWKSLFEDTPMVCNEESDNPKIKLPKAEVIANLQLDIFRWEKILGENSQRFGGDCLLCNQESFLKMAKEVEKWSDVGMILFERHRSDTTESCCQQSVMKYNAEQFHLMRKQMDVRITGENGAAIKMMTLQNNFEVWNAKLLNLKEDCEAISDFDWVKLYYVLADSESLLAETKTLISSGVQGNEKEGENNILAVELMISNVQMWLKGTVNGIEGENGKMASQISSIHTSMVSWMVQILLLLAPDRDTKIPSESSLKATCTLDELALKCQDISDNLSRITSYLCECVRGIIQMTAQGKNLSGEEDANLESRDFARLGMECKEWIRTCQLLLNSKLENPVTLLDETVLSRLQSRKFNATEESNERHRLHDATHLVETFEEENGNGCASENQETILNQTKSSLSFEAIGTDENVQPVFLSKSDKEKSCYSLNLPSSDLTKTAYEAIADMEKLTQQLLSTEERAQTAESQKLELEESLISANERIRALERKLDDVVNAADLVAVDPVTDIKESALDEKLIVDSTDRLQMSDATKRTPSRGSSEKRKGKQKKK